MIRLLRRHVHFLIERFQSNTAALSTFLAYLRAATAMCMVVPGAFLGAVRAGFDAYCQNRSDQIAVMAGATHRCPRRKVADIRTIKAQADALRHVHWFCNAGVGAGIADRRAIDRVFHRLAEARVIPCADFGVFGNHRFD